ncbi:nitroreductase family protein [Fusibacter ferrireducens]|uniref:Nitroreductase family protein n=1 Tax=Fusibacter ferrireducens TaxID=2785058 RepID=A0ABR9ZTJ6_9FIRM|nr:nitroreductase family protein [Fusibacter ferrireducens]MBF4693777.1 nitroreductase family protein [Fusibacter ferrireducens]
MANSASLTRRSIRKFTGEKLSEALLDEILKAGFASPTAKNTQLWEFVVVDDMNILNAFKEVHRFSMPLIHAGLGILVCGDLNKEEHEGYWIGDCAAAIQNMLIRIEELELGACWIGVYPNEDRMAVLEKTLNLPEHIKPMGFIAVGHPDEKKAPSDRYDPEKVHRNGW